LLSYTEREELPVSAKSGCYKAWNARATIKEPQQRAISLGSPTLVLITICTKGLN
jgi:hypothetical protein